MYTTTSFKPHCLYLLLKFFISLTSILYCSISNAQISDYASDRLAKELNELSSKYEKEEIYIQTNKDIYITGEDLWFKGYVLDAQHFTPSMRSDIFFLQLIKDDTSEVFWEEKYQISQGFVDGHVFIFNQLEPGDYTLVGYTPYSSSKSDKIFYGLKQIKIVTSTKGIGKKIEKDSTLSTDSIIKFAVFPEGGHLISDIENKLAFKALNSKNHPVDVSGTLFENNIPIISFKSEHDGMGSFNFVPDKNKSYHIILGNISDSKSFNLPKIKAEGKLLQLASQTKKFVYFKIKQNKTRKSEYVFLRLQVRGIVYKVAYLLLKDESIFKISLEDIPQGIAEVTLFDEYLKPLAERLIYINHNQKLYLEATLDKDAYISREAVKLKIKATDQFNLPIVANLGLSVHDKLFKNPTEAKTIETHYYLNTQLKGNIFNPEYYFDAKNANRKKALDLLLLTQGWRQYTWNDEDVSYKVSHQYNLFNNTIEGLFYSKNKQPYSKNFVVVATSDENGPKEFVEVGPKGIFELTRKHLNLGNNSYLYIKPLGKDKNDMYTITIRDIISDSLNKYRQLAKAIYPYKKQPKSLLKTVESFQVSEKTQHLNEVILKKKKDKIYRDAYLGKLNALNKIKRAVNTDYVCSYNFLNCANHPLGGTLPIVGQAYLAYENGKLVRVIYEGQRKNNGENLSEAELLKQFNLSILKGFYGKRKFYNLEYDENSVNDPFPDSRNTLFWKPNIITDENGEAEITFYCSDTNARFNGVIEGVSYDGLIGAENFTFMVRKRPTK